MNKNINILHYNKFILLIVFILQFKVGFSQINYDIEDPDVFENDDIVVYRNPETETLQIIAIKRIIDNTFPNHIVINGTDYPIYTISPIKKYVEWPKERPDSLIIPEGIMHIGSNFTVYNFKGHVSMYRNLRYLKLPNTLESIGNDAFYKNYINDLIIPPSVFEIGKEAFMKCDIENLDLGSVQFIGAGAFMDCENLKWVRIPKETRIIGRRAFNRQFSENRRLFFLQLSPVDINPVIDFANTFGSVDIPYVACASEFLNPGIKATYQSDMPKVFENRAMIHLEECPVPLYFSFEQAGEKEGLWEPGIDLWARTGERSQKDSLPKKSKSDKEARAYPQVAKADLKKVLDIYSPPEKKQEDIELTSTLPAPEEGIQPLYYPVTFRIDTSSLPEKKRGKLRVFYNDRDITDSVADDSFTISYGKSFDSEAYSTGAEPIYNRLKITFE